MSFFREERGAGGNGSRLNLVNCQRIFHFMDFLMMIFKFDEIYQQF